jgi:hypothetical protein
VIYIPFQTAISSSEVNSTSKIRSTTYSVYTQQSATQNQLQVSVDIMRLTTATKRKYSQLHGFEISNLTGPLLYNNTKYGYAAL